VTQHKDRKALIRARMAATGEPYTEAARNISAPHRPRGSSMWLNPPRHDDPHEDIIIELHPAAAAAVSDALAEAAEWATRDGDEETARLLAHTANDIEAASVTPAEADAAGLSGRRPGIRPTSCPGSPPGRSGTQPATRASRNNGTLSGDSGPPATTLPAGPASPSDAGGQHQVVGVLMAGDVVPVRYLAVVAPGQGGLGGYGPESSRCDSAGQGTWRAGGVSGRGCAGGPR
jgi:hypothetical protein